MIGAFAAATAVTPLEAGGDTCRFAAEVVDGWDVGGNANGGYLLALVGRAMSEVAGRPPLSVTAHYLRPAPAGACRIDVRPVRAGRRLATVGATLTMDGTPVVEALGTFGEQTPGGEPWIGEEPPELPAYEECVEPPGPAEGPGPNMNERLANRLRPGDDGFRYGRPTGTPEVRGWFALADHEPIDAFALLLASDAFVPPVFNTELPVAWVPTVELTVHVRGVPAPGPLRCRFHSRFIDDGLLDEEGVLFDSTGRLVAMSRQLALVPRPT